MTMSSKILLKKGEIIDQQRMKPKTQKNKKFSINYDYSLLLCMMSKYIM